MQDLDEIVEPESCLHGLQFQFRVGPGNFCCVHVSLVPVLGVVGEQKTKPTQHSVAVLRSLGLNPHLLACRSPGPALTAVRDKLVRCMSTVTCLRHVLPHHCNSSDEPSPAWMLACLHSSSCHACGCHHTRCSNEHCSGIVEG